jgi:hypothetical protein
MAKGTQYKVRFTKWNGEGYARQEQIVAEGDIETFLETVETDGGEILSKSKIVITPNQLFCKSFKLDDNRYELQVVEYGGEFLLREYVNDKPIELALGIKMQEATDAYNQYVQARPYPETCQELDFSLYMGHGYSRITA